MDLATATAIFEVVKYMYEHPEIVQSGVNTMTRIVSHIQVRYGDLGLARLQKAPFSKKDLQVVEGKMQKLPLEKDDTLQALISELLISLADPKLDAVQRTAGEARIEATLVAYLNNLMSVRMTTHVADVDLLSDNIGRVRGIPHEIRADSQKLHANVVALIRQVTDSIETRHRLATPSLDLSALTPIQKKSAVRLVKGDAQARTSYKTIRTTFDIFSNLNETIVRRIDSSSGLESQQRLLANAILVYELTQCVITYLRTVKLAGLDELSSLYNEMRGNLNKARWSEKTLTLKSQVQMRRGLLSQQALQTVNKEIEAREQAYTTLDTEWKQYLGEYQTLESGVNGLRRLISTMEIQRNSAKNQIQAMEMILAFTALKENARMCQDNLSELTKIRLVPLSPERVRRLILA